MTGYAFLLVFGLAAIAYLMGRGRALRVAGSDHTALHSRPIYHGASVAIWTGAPAFVLLLAWLLLQDSVVDQLILASFQPAAVDELSSAERSLLISEVRQVAAGTIFREPSPAVEAAAARLQSWQDIATWAMVACTAAVGLLGLVVSYRSITTSFRARFRVERALNYFMVFCSVVAIVTTLGIIASLLYEAMQFFRRVPASEFFFGLNWEPQIPLREDQIAGAGAFGAVPVFLGTIVIAALAMLVATPIGLLSAIYLTQYATPRLRTVVKPILEILAGVPTVVYGFFAVLTVAPAMRDLGLSIGLDVSPNSALAAGGVMGIMIIPFISSLSDDALTAVPGSMRDGSYAMGATKSETIRKVLIPAALPGIVGGVLLALSRAIGETMIVVMAAGLIASMNVNPLQSVTTVTVQIVTLLIGDSEFDNPKTLAAFALGLILFVITLALNVFALHIVRKYREKY